MNTCTLIPIRMLAALALSFLFSACIEELENLPTLEGKLVINGQFSGSEDLRQLRVLRVDDATGKGEIIPSTAQIFKNGSSSVELIPDNLGILRLPLSYQIEEGAEYFVEVTLASGEVYRSTPQVVAPLFRTDTVTHRILPNNPVPLDTLGFNAIEGIEFYAHVEVPEPEEEERYYRWVIDESWSFVESNKTDTCYVLESIGTNRFALYTNTDPDVETGEITIPILTHPLDKSFLYQHYINAYLHSIDKITYNYYEQVDKITGDIGTLYDEVPGPIDGNVKNVEDPTERIGGFVEFFLADTFRLRLRRRRIAANVPRQCDDVPGGGPCPPDPTTPCQCLVCEAILGEDALIPPDYWEE